MAKASALVEWFKSEFLTPRRLLFNILWYGSHLGVFAYGWYSQVGHLSITTERLYRT